jgi:hypothetical protein
MGFLKNFLLKQKASKDRKAIQGALDLHTRGEVRRDGPLITWRSSGAHGRCIPGIAPLSRSSESFYSQSSLWRIRMGPYPVCSMSCLKSM